MLQYDCSTLFVINSCVAKSQKHKKLEIWTINRTGIRGQPRPRLSPAQFPRFPYLCVCVPASAHCSLAPVCEKCRLNCCLNVSFYSVSKKNLGCVATELVKIVVLFLKILRYFLSTNGTAALFRPIMTQNLDKYCERQLDFYRRNETCRHIMSNTLRLVILTIHYIEYIVHLYIGPVLYCNSMESWSTLWWHVECQ